MLNFVYINSTGEGETLGAEFQTHMIWETFGFISSDIMTFFIFILLTPWDIWRCVKIFVWKYKHIKKLKRFLVLFSIKFLLILHPFFKGIAIWTFCSLIYFHLSANINHCFWYYPTFLVWELMTPSPSLIVSIYNVNKAWGPLVPPPLPLGVENVKILK